MKNVVSILLPGKIIDLQNRWQRSNPKSHLNESSGQTGGGAGQAHVLFQDNGHEKDNGVDAAELLKELDEKAQQQPSHGFQLCLVVEDAFQSDRPLLSFEFEGFLHLVLDESYLVIILNRVHEPREDSDGLFLAVVGVQPPRGFREERHGGHGNESEDDLKGNWEAPDHLAER